MDSVLAEPCELDALVREAYVAQEPLIGWLGQAGFLIRSAHAAVGDRSVLVRFAGHQIPRNAFPHTRLMPPPIAPEQLTGVQVVLCTHAHTDHMDPETLPRIAAASPQCLFVVPRASSRRPCPRRACGAFGDDRCRRAGCVGGGSGGSRAARRARTAGDGRPGRHRFLGYLLHLGDRRSITRATAFRMRVWASSWPLARSIWPCLPVNGRDEERRAKGCRAISRWTRRWDCAFAAASPPCWPAILVCLTSTLWPHRGWTSRLLSCRVVAVCATARGYAIGCYQAPRPTSRAHCGGPWHESATCSPVLGSWSGRRL